MFREIAILNPHSDYAAQALFRSGTINFFTSNGTKTPSKTSPISSITIPMMSSPSNPRPISSTYT